jgi:hypothetical protein
VENAAWSEFLLVIGILLARIVQLFGLFFGVEVV